MLKLCSLLFAGLLLIGVCHAAAQEASPGIKSLNESAAATKQSSPLTLDPKTTALILVDLEQSTVSSPLAPHSSAQVVESSLGLVKKFRAAGAMVVFSRVLVTKVVNLPIDQPLPIATGAPSPTASDLIPQLGVQPNDLVVTKEQWGAFYGTNLDEQLRRRGIKTIVLGGIATNCGVETTARDAFDRGYALVFAADAMSSLTTEDHDFAVRHIFPLMGRVRTAEQIVAALK